MDTAAHWIFVLTFAPAITCGLTHADLTASETRLLAAELGATPDTLTAAGFTLSTAQQALARLAAQEQAAAAMREQRTLVATLQSQIKSLNAQARASTETTDLQQIESELNAARAALATAAAQAESARSQLIAALVGPAVDLELAERVFFPSTLPAAYRVVELNGQQLSELGSALSAERHAQVRGQTPSAQVQQTLAGFRSIPAISAALQAQSAHLAEVSYLFHAAQ